jgi:glucuronokinase
LIIRKISYPRAAVIGNPSDGFYGKTIAFPFSNFHAEARLIVSQEIKLSAVGDHSFANLEAFYEDYLLNGVPAENPLLNATVKKFIEYCKSEDMSLHNRGFEIEFESTIPREVGLAGSSAIITAILRTLIEYYWVSIPLEIQANLILEVETQELGISAGLQDRVVQVFENPVYMDFDKHIMERNGYGDYKVISPNLFENNYIAYRTEEIEGSEVVHNDLRSRFDEGDKMVHNVMEDLSDLTTEYLNALNQKQGTDLLGGYMNRNFDLRQSICKISKNNLEMIELARSVGASSKFTGSGGAIIGNYASEKMYAELEKAFNYKGIQIFKPTIVGVQR